MMEDMDEENHIKIAFLSISLFKLLWIGSRLKNDVEKEVICRAGNRQDFPESIQFFLILLIDSIYLDSIRFWV